MKNLLLILFLLITTLSFCQSFDQKLASQIYKRIDSTATLKCCDLDNAKNITRLTYSYKTDFDFESIEMVSTQKIYDDIYFQIESTELIDDIVESWSKKIGNKKFHFSCYQIDKQILIQDTNDYSDVEVKVNLNLIFYFY